MEGYLVLKTKIHSFKNNEVKCFPFSFFLTWIIIYRSSPPILSSSVAPRSTLRWRYSGLRGVELNETLNFELEGFEGVKFDGFEGLKLKFDMGESPINELSAELLLPKIYDWLIDCLCVK